MRDDALSVVICGSSAAGAMPGYLGWMRQEIELDLRVLLTKSAERFIRPEMIAWYADETYTSDDPGLNPTEFAKRSYAMVVLPATANMLASVALGLASTPAQTALLASDRPAIFFPSMNKSMWAKRSMQRHIRTLRAEGHQVIDPKEMPVFELWRKEMVPGIAMPPPAEAVAAIIDWLEKDDEEKPEE